MFVRAVEDVKRGTLVHIPPLTLDIVMGARHISLVFEILFIWLGIIGYSELILFHAPEVLIIRMGIMYNSPCISFYLIGNRDDWGLYTSIVRSYVKFYQNIFDLIRALCFLRF